MSNGHTLSVRDRSQSRIGHTPQAKRRLTIEANLDHWIREAENAAKAYRDLQRTSTGSELRDDAMSALWFHQQAQRLLQLRDSATALHEPTTDTGNT